MPSQNRNTNILHIKNILASSSHFVFAANFSNGVGTEIWLHRNIHATGARDNWPASS